MNNIKLLTGGLVVIVLGLAGGTGYLIYERIQNEVNHTERATKQDIQEIQKEQADQKQDILSNKDKIRLNETQIGTNKKKISTNAAEISLNADSIVQLRKDSDAGDAQAQKLIDHLEKEQAELQKDTDSLIEQNKQIQSDIKGLKAELAAQGDRISEQEKKIDELAEKGDARDQEIAALRAEMAELKKQLGLGEPDPSN